MRRPLLLPLLLLVVACGDEPRLQAVGPRQDTRQEPKPAPQPEPKPDPERAPEPEAPPACNAPGPCSSAAFDPEAGACTEQPLPDGTPCVAPCLEAAACHAGRCEGAPRSCDDGNPCTRDACLAGQCQNDEVECAIPDDPCLTAVCDPETGCGTAPAPDGVRCGVLGCDSRAVCMAGLCTQQQAMDGDVCDGICTVGVCADGTCAEPGLVEASWSLDTGRPFYDDASGALIAITGGALNRVHRDGSLELVSVADPQPFLSAIAGHYGIAGGRWYWEHLSYGLRAAGIDGRSSWHLDRDEPAGPSLRVRTMLSDGAVVAQVGASLWRISPDGQMVFLQSPCEDSNLDMSSLDLLADERDTVYVAWKCEGAEMSHLASFHGVLPLQPLRWQPPSGTFCRPAGVFAGQLALRCNGQPLLLLDLTTGVSIALGDGNLQALTADRAYLRHAGTIRAMRLPDGAEVWSRNIEESWPGCTPDFCTPVSLGPVAPMKSGTALLYAHGTPQDGWAFMRWLIELRDDGTIARTCRLGDYLGYASPHRSWFADGLWLDLGNDHFGLEAFELTGRPRLAPGWIGGSGGPAGGDRPWVPTAPVRNGG